MAMKPCRECKTKISSRAKRCPSCGIDKPFEMAIQRGLHSFAKLCFWLGAILTILAIFAVAAAEEPRITNEASGLACYDAQQLLDAHNALGFYNMAHVRELVEAGRCFLMRPKWRVRIDGERFIGGADVTMLKIWLEVRSGQEARFAWTLEGNIATD